MAVNTSKCNRLMPLHFKGLMTWSVMLPKVMTTTSKFIFSSLHLQNFYIYINVMARLVNIEVSSIANTVLLLLFQYRCCYLHSAISLKRNINNKVSPIIFA